jgi:hypothetical protein
MLVEVSYNLVSGSTHKKIVLILDTAAIIQLARSNISEDPKSSPALENGLTLWHMLPSFLSQHIELALSFLARDRLIFLDHNFWVCSMTIPNITSAGDDDTSNGLGAFRRKSGGL